MERTQILRERLPCAEAAPYLGCVWVHTLRSGGSAHVHRRVPNGCIDLIYKLDTPSISVLGPRSRHSFDHLEPGTTLVGLRFHPGVGASILGAPAQELAGPGVVLEDFWGRRAIDLAERASGAPSPHEAARLLETELARRAADRVANDPLMLAMLDVLRRLPRVDLGRLAADLSLSHRQLRRRCHAVFGYGPKALQRIIRFQRFRAYCSGYATENVPLNRLAWAAGYADQPHLTRECLSISGLPPRRLLAQTHRRCAENHTHVALFAPFVRAATEPMWD
jgi:AraC-like DNA-binding protein